MSETPLQTRRYVRENRAKGDMYAPLDHFAQHPHRRLNLLSGEWVLVSPHRTSRPWQGQHEPAAAAAVPAYDPACYMCPGNTRASGISNPKYERTFAFANDFAALEAHTPSASYKAGGLLRAHSESGICRVLCFSPRHDLTLSRLPIGDFRHVVDAWASQRAELAARPDIGYVQIFENRGAMMGASNPHPHGQIWANATIPNEVAREQTRQRLHYEQCGRDLLGDYLEIELDDGQRIVCHNDAFVALVPFWAMWPFETLILPRRRVATVDGLDQAERDGLAELLKRLLTRYDNLFDVSFSYSMGFHEAPADDAAHPDWRWHAHIYPPLLRSATVRKFMVGYELLAMPQRDTTPENAAERVRSLPETHRSA
jgi:UDPglucose--hexose-1-phosphate uridylyltransferase